MSLFPPQHIRNVYGELKLATHLKIGKAAIADINQQLEDVALRILDRLRMLNMRMPVKTITGDMVTLAFDCLFANVVESKDNKQDLKTLARKISGARARFENTKPHDEHKPKQCYAGLNLSFGKLGTFILQHGSFNRRSDEAVIAFAAGLEWLCACRLQEAHRVTSENGGKIIKNASPSPLSSPSPSPSPSPAPARSVVGTPTPCCICIDKPPTHAVVPCGHKCLCIKCAGKCKALPTCPLCHTTKKSIVRIYES